VSTVTLTRKRELKWLSPDKVIQNNNNPRGAQAFTPDELASLRRSITAHGILEPIIVAPYRGDTYRLIEGERRWQSAKLEGLKEIPAIVVNRMEADEELVVMFNVHTQRRSWETSEQLEAIKRLMEANPEKTDEELAAELGVSIATFRDRRQVLKMGDAVITSIAKGEIEYYAALRADQLSKTLVRNRPELAERLGGEDGVRQRLLTKARHTKARNRKGITRDLENIRRDAADTEAVPDDVLEVYIEKPQATLSEARSQTKSLAERRAVEELVRDINNVNSRLRLFSVDLAAAPNLTDLRKALVKLIDTAQGLEVKIVDIRLESEA
jgi:ParB/RepB/Spo0J family partition protein